MTPTIFLKKNDTHNVRGLLTFIFKTTPVSTHPKLPATTIWDEKE